MNTRTVITITCCSCGRFEIGYRDGSNHNMFKFTPIRPDIDSRSFVLAGWQYWYLDEHDNIYCQKCYDYDPDPADEAKLAA